MAPWHFEAPFFEDLKPLGIGDGELELGDNKRLLINILDWLGRRLKR